MNFNSQPNEFRGLFTALAACILFIGCGSDGGMKFVPVSGTVTVDGQPAANVMVRFKPVPVDGDINSGPVSIAFTDESGKYSLQADSGQHSHGAVPGTHRVLILGKESLGVVSSWSKGSPEDYPPGEAPPDIRTPPVIEVPMTDPVEFIVPDTGTSDANFDL
ncbi:transthyretin-like family protein [Calycomorphotria hydatis]|uniref:Carboxypeptidase regulatory-like domain-containing protein n=1 Tax=Calycomorphotria hydatis TaxID=2528027 RepID=A0A517T5T9_9PLAN|nr:hypothetical protein [Calycomorphotria hydatis]QDT63729.1 hypothetical protein V22_09540 [Calycomorphotria hydatis]